MENILLGVILLSAQVLTVSSAPIVPVQNGCAEGEPSVGDIQPDVNITVLPSQAVLSFTPLDIICDANIARFPSSLPGPPQPPVRILIHVGIYRVKECEDGGVNPVFQCIYNLTSFFPGLPRRFSCTAFNANGQCRFRSANITILPPPPVSTTANIPQSNITMAVPTVQRIDFFPTTTNPPDVTTPGPSLPITNVSTSTNVPQSTTTVPITNATTTPPTEKVTTTLPPPTPTDDRESTTRTPVVLTTEAVIPPIPTTTSTTKKDDGNDDSDGSDDDSDSDSDSDSDDD